MPYLLLKPRVTLTAVRCGSDYWRSSLVDTTFIRIIGGSDLIHTAGFGSTVSAIDELRQVSGALMGTDPGCEHTADRPPGLSPRFQGSPPDKAPAVKGYGLTAAGLTK